MATVKQELKFGVEEAAKLAKVSTAYLRVRLRQGKVKRSGRSYGWASKEAMIKDLKRIKALAA